MRVLIIQLFVNGLITASFYALAGVTWGVIYRTTHIFHFSHHLVFSVAGYAAVMITAQAQLPYFFGFFAAVGAAALLGCGIDAFLYRRLRMAGATQATTFLASLGFGTAGVAILLLAFTSSPRRLVGFPTKVLSIGEAFFSVADLTMVIVSWTMIGLLLLFLAKSRYGKAIRAVGINAEMARNVGLNYRSTLFACFCDWVRFVRGGGVSIYSQERGLSDHGDPSLFYVIYRCFSGRGDQYTGTCARRLHSWTC